MAFVAVKAYGLIWRADTDEGRIDLRLSDGRTLSVPVETAAEFAAVAAVLREEPVYYDPDTGILRTDWEEVDGV